MNQQKDTDLPLNRNISQLRQKVRRLDRISLKKLDSAICDIIDLKGLSLAALLASMPGLKVRVQRRIAQRIEDFIYFHPSTGRKLLTRFAKVSRKVDSSCLPYLVSAVADIIHQVGPRPAIVMQLKDEICKVLTSETDLTRKAKAVELAAQTKSSAMIPLIIENLQESLKKLTVFDNFQFAEIALFSLKQLAGETFLKLLIHSDSPSLQQQFRIERRNYSTDQQNKALDSLKLLPDDAPELLLKVIELSEFSLPFLPMIQEGLDDDNKWIRQMATASMQRLKDGVDVEQLNHLLKDPAQEVRLMAVTSLGGYPSEQTGEKLIKIASDAEEPPEVRQNALYALFSQKNLKGLQKLAKATTPQIALNAQGLAAMLIPRLEGLQTLLKTMVQLPDAQGDELFPFLLEVSKPEDLPLFLDFYQKEIQAPADKAKAGGEGFVRILRGYLQTKAGEAMDKIIETLPKKSQDIIHLLQGKI